MNEAEDKGPRDISGSWGGHMRSGAFWMIALRWSIRLTGLVSTLVLARLLLPRDFGIVAMASIVVGGLEIFNQTGQLLALIRLQNPTKAHYDSAWTVSFLIGLAITLAIEMIAPLTVAYFHEPNVVPVIQCLALRAFLGGVENVGIIDFRRDLRFNRFFVYNVCPKLLSFVVTLVTAILWRNYWALVAGMLTGQTTRIILSYAMHPYRPRFTFAATSEIWSFSIWTFVRTIGAYLITQVDQIAVGGISGSATMGRYAVASDVASSPSREINEPMVAVIFPVMSRLQNDQQALREVFLSMLGWSTVICVSASAGVALIAEDLSNLILGPKWIDIGPLMIWLSIGAGFVGLNSGAYALFDALGLPHHGARMEWVRVAALTLLVFPVAYLTKSLIIIAIVRALAFALCLPGLYHAVGKLVQISSIDYVRTLWRPFAAAAVMTVVVLGLNHFVPITGSVRLFTDVFAGALSYAAASFVFWVVSDCPRGPEADTISSIRRMLTQRRLGSLVRRISWRDAR